MTGDPDPLLMHLGLAVQGHRKRLGLTLRELARRSSLSERFLGEVERGRANPSVLRLAGIARALDVPLEELLRPTPEVPAARTNGERSVALLGLRGAGKSTVGGALARTLGWRFREVDDEVEATVGLTLAEIFELHGERYYRRAERDVLLALLAAAEPQVLATAGGIVTEPETFTALRDNTRTVWLRARPEDHWERVAAQGDTRPMEGNEGAFSHMCAILSEREKLYEQADFTVETSGRTVDDICAEVAGQLSTTT